jgi:nicotinate-nucleotide adenylyltransferase
MKIGVLGGTFDPVHLAHIGMAEEARDTLGLDQVILVPAGRPVSKVRPITSAENRIEMLRLAVKNKPRLSISTIEIDRPGLSYTVDTLAALKQESGKGTEIYFILGWDSLEQLPEWREPDRLVVICHLIAVPRPGVGKPDLKQLENRIPGIAKKVIMLGKPNIDISATGIREKIAQGKPVGKLVPRTVAAYIKKHKLYQASGGRP